MDRGAFVGYASLNQGDDKVTLANGGTFVEVLRTGDGNDDVTIKGRAGFGTLDVGAGDDTVKGGARDERLDGGDGDDVLQGRKGDDILTGGEGGDVFRFKTRDGADTITDLELGLDEIAIRGVNRLNQMQFEQQGDDVVVSFRRLEVTVEDVAREDLRDAETFGLG